MHVPDDISEITTDDPLEAFVAIDRTIRPTPAQEQNYPSNSDIWRYYETVTHAAKMFGIQFDVQPRTGLTENEKHDRLFDDLITAVEKKKIELLIDRVASRTGIALDQTWRSRIHSYCAHIREIVEKAGLDESLRQSIMTRINDLEREVDRSRTRLRAFGDLMMALCTGMGTGARELEPALRAAERISGAVGGLGVNPPQVLLPSPDKFGLEAAADVASGPRLISNAG